MVSTYLQPPPGLNLRPLVKGPKFQTLKTRTAPGNFANLVP